LHICAMFLWEHLRLLAAARHPSRGRGAVPTRAGLPVHEEGGKAVKVFRCSADVIPQETYK